MSAAAARLPRPQWDRILKSTTRKGKKITQATNHQRESNQKNVESKRESRAKERTDGIVEEGLGIVNGSPEWRLLMILALADNDGGGTPATAAADDARRLGGIHRRPGVWVGFFLRERVRLQALIGSDQVEHKFSQLYS